MGLPADRIIFNGSKTSWRQRRADLFNEPRLNPDSYFVSLEQVTKGKATLTGKIRALTVTGRSGASPHNMMIDIEVSPDSFDRVYTQLEEANFLCDFKNKDRKSPYYGKMGVRSHKPRIVFHPHQGETIENFIRLLQILDTVQKIPLQVLNHFCRKHLDFSEAECGEIFEAVRGVKSKASAEIIRQPQEAAEFAERQRREEQGRQDRERERVERELKERQDKEAKDRFESEIAEQERLAEEKRVRDEAAEQKARQEQQAAQEQTDRLAEAQRQLAQLNASVGDASGLEPTLSLSGGPSGRSTAAEPSAAAGHEASVNLNKPRIVERRSRCWG